MDACGCTGEGNGTNMKLTPLKSVFVGAGVGIAVLLGLGAANLTKYVGRFYGDGFNLTNLNVVTTNIYATSNFFDVLNSYQSNEITINTNVTINNNLTIQTNLIVNQNVTVKGNATVNTIIITNSVLYSTNAFPLTAGTFTWDWSRYFQFISTNNDFNITGIAGLSNNLLNQAELLISNAGSGNITIGLTFAGNKIGPNTTNSIVLPSHKQAYVNGEVRGIGTVTNYVTQTEQ